MNSMLTALEKALQLLTCADRTATDVRARLSNQGYPSSEIDQVITDLQRTGVISDERWLENKLMEMEKLRPQSLQRVQLELKKHGLTATQIEAKWIELGLEEHTLALNVAERKIKALPDKSRKSREKLTRHLASRGFSWNVINNVFGQLDF